MPMRGSSAQSVAVTVTEYSLCRSLSNLRAVTITPANATGAHSWMQTSLPSIHPSNYPSVRPFIHPSVSTSLCALGTCSLKESSGLWINPFKSLLQIKRANVLFSLLRGDALCNLEMAWMWFYSKPYLLCGHLFPSLLRCLRRSLTIALKEPIMHNGFLLL